MDPAEWSLPAKIPRGQRGFFLDTQTEGWWFKIWSQRPGVQDIGEQKQA